MPLKLVASKHASHLAGDRSGEGNNQHVSPVQRHKTQHKTQQSLNFFSATYCRLHKTLLGSKRHRKGQRVPWTNSKRSDMFVAKWPRPEGGTAFPPVLFLNFSLFGCLDEALPHRNCGLDHGSVMSWYVAHVDPSSNSCRGNATPVRHAKNHLVARVSAFGTRPVARRTRRKVPFWGSWVRCVDRSSELVRTRPQSKVDFPKPSVQIGPPARRARRQERKLCFLNLWSLIALNSREGEFKNWSAGLWELSLPLSKVLLYQYDKVLPYQVKQFRVRWKKRKVLHAEYFFFTTVSAIWCTKNIDWQRR